jgi:hypothetical protein
MKTWKQFRGLSYAQSLLPSIEQDVINLAPEFRVLSIVVEASAITHPHIAQEVQDRDCRSVARVVQAGPIRIWLHGRMSSESSVLNLSERLVQQSPCANECSETAVWPALIPWWISIMPSVFNMLCPYVGAVAELI